MTPQPRTLQEDKKLNKNALMRILDERGQFQKSSVEIGLKQRFRHQNRKLGNVVSNITNY